jgi:hypothetical protein
MAPRTTIRHVSFDDLVKGGGDTFDDPQGIAAVDAEKLVALTNNPFSWGRDRVPAQILGMSGNEVIGRLDFVPGMLWHGDHDVEILWTSRLYVAPEHRSTLMGLKLILEMQRLHHTVGASGPADHIWPLFKNLHWRDVPFDRYVMVRRSRSVVGAFVTNPALARVLAVSADLALAAQRVVVEVQSRLAERGLRLAEYESAPSGPWPRPLHEVRGARSADWMDWLLGSSFESGRRLRGGLFGVTAADGALLARFLLKSRFYPASSERTFSDMELGSLQDWELFDPSSLGFGELVTLAVGVLGSWDVDAIDISVPAGYARPPRRLGFLRYGSMHHFVRAAPPSSLAGPEPVGSWVLRPAEGDSFFT